MLPRSPARGFNSGQYSAGYYGSYQASGVVLNQERDHSRDESLLRDDGTRLSNLLCKKHNKRVKYFCMAPHCPKDVLLCSKCLIYDISHAPLHHNSIYEIDELVVGAAGRADQNGNDAKIRFPFNSESLRSSIRELKAMKKMRSSQKAEDEKVLQADVEAIKEYMVAALDEIFQEVKLVLKKSADELNYHLDRCIEDAERVANEVDGRREAIVRDFGRFNKNKDVKGLENYVKKMSESEILQTSEKVSEIIAQKNQIITGTSGALRYKISPESDFGTRCQEVLDEFRKVIQDILQSNCEMPSETIITTENLETSPNPETEPKNYNHEVSFSKDQGGGYEKSPEVLPEETQHQKQTKEVIIPLKVEKLSKESGMMSETPSKLFAASLQSSLRGRGDGFREPSHVLVNPKNSKNDLDPSKFVPFDYMEDPQHLLTKDPMSFTVLRHEKIIETDHNEGITALCLVNDEILFTASADFTIKAWSLHDFSYLNTLTGHSGVIRQIAHVNRKGRDLLLSVGDDKLILLWDVNDVRNVRLIWQVIGHSMSILNVLPFPNSPNFITCSRDQTIRLWNIDNGEEVMKPLKKHRSVVVSLAVMKGGKVFCSGGFDKMINVWAIESRDEQVYAVGLDKSLEHAHDDAVFTMVASHYDENLLISGGYDNQVKIWNIFQGKCLKTLSGHHDRVVNLSLLERSLDGNFSKFFEIQNSNLRILSAGFGIVSISRDKTLKFWLNKKEKRVVINNALDYNGFSAYNMGSIQLFRTKVRGNYVNKIITCADGDFRLHVFVLE